MYVCICIYAHNFFDYVPIKTLFSMAFLEIFLKILHSTQFEVLVQEF